MSSTQRTAILLAAGCARRLRHLTLDRPKCLLEIGGTTLIEHQIEALRELGVRDVVVVTGYFAEKVEAVCGDIARFVRNPIFDATNSLYSLHLALAEVEGPFVLTNADVLFHRDLLARLLDSPWPDALLYEPSETLGDEEMKVRVENGFVRAMAKTLPRGAYHGENLGLLKFSSAGAGLLRNAAARLVGEGQVNAWAPRAFDSICDELPIHAIAASGLPWIEIDFPEDLDAARSTVWPRLAARSPVAAKREDHAAT